MGTIYADIELINADDLAPARRNKLHKDISAILQGDRVRISVFESF